VFTPFHDFGIKLTAITLIMLLTWLNMSSLKSGAGTSKIIMILVATGLLTIIVFGLTSHVDRPVEVMTAGTVTNGAVTLSAFFAAMLAAFWAYQGWASVGFIGGEIKEANRSIPKGIVIGVFIVIGVYLLVNFTYLKVLSVQQLEAIHAAGNKIAAIEAVRAFWGKGGVLFISVLILITTLGCTNASVLTGARPTYAMAREGLFFPGIAKLNKANVPANSLLLQGIWSSVLVLSGSFDQLTDMLIFAVFIFYGATSLGVIILRRRMPDAHRPYKVWGYPVVPVFYILFCIALFVNTIVTKPREAAIGLILIAAGIPVYMYLQRKTSKQKE
jgi:APA family basic amino acid/polyamine antiporter